VAPLCDERRSRAAAVRTSESSRQRFSVCERARKAAASSATCARSTKKVHRKHHGHFAPSEIAPKAASTANAKP
jgi:hypothetical protein